MLYDIYEFKKSKKSFDDFLLDYMYNRKVEFDHGQTTAARCGKAMVYRIFEAWLVGYQAKVAELLPRAIAWIDEGLAEGELTDHDDGGTFYHMIFHQAKGLGLWMLNNQQPESVFHIAQTLCAKSMTFPNTYCLKDLKSVAVDDYMAFAYMAGQYAEAIALYEKMLGKPAKLSYSNIKTLRALAYAMCLDKIEPQFDKLKLQAAGKKILDAKMWDTWLGYGQTSEIVTWIKMVYWEFDQTMTPLEVSLKVYDHLPGMIKPF